MTYNLENWGQQTCLSIAVTSRHLEFVAHSSCQDLITRRWTGALHMPGRQAWKVRCPWFFKRKRNQHLKFKKKKKTAYIMR